MSTRSTSCSSRPLVAPASSSVDASPRVLQRITELEVHNEQLRHIEEVRLRRLRRAREAASKQLQLEREVSSASRASAGPRVRPGLAAVPRPAPLAYRHDRLHTETSGLQASRLNSTKARSPLPLPPPVPEEVATPCATLLQGGASFMTPSAIEAIRREQAAVKHRVAMAELAIREKSCLLQAERNRVQQQWLQLQQQEELVSVSSASLLPQPPSVKSSSPRSLQSKETTADTYAAWAQLAQEHATLSDERQAVREKLTVADQRLCEALAVGRGQAELWEVQTAKERTAEEYMEAILQEKLEAQEICLRTRLQEAELQERERLCQATAVAQERVREAMEAGRSQVLEWEVHAAAQRNAEVTREREAWKMLEAQSVAMEVRLGQEELAARAAQKAELRSQQEAWREQAEAEVHLEVLASVRRAEEHAAQQEAQVGALCVEEHRLLMEQSEALTEARLEKAKQEVEQSAKQQVACIREEWQVHHAAWARESEVKSALRQEALTKRISSEEAHREEAWAKKALELEAAREQTNAEEFQHLLEERREVQEELAVARAEQEEAIRRAGSEDAGTHVICDPASVQKPSCTPIEGHHSDPNPSSECLLPEVCEPASADDEQSQQLQRDYAARLGGLLAETARLKKETLLLAQERNAVLAGCPSFTAANCLETPAAACQHLGLGVPASTSASSGAGADWEPGDPAPTTRSFSSRSSGLGPSISARGQGRWLTNFSPAGSPISSPLDLPPQISFSHMFDAASRPSGMPGMPGLVDPVATVGGGFLSGGQLNWPMPQCLDRDHASGCGSTSSWSSQCAAPAGHRGTQVDNGQGHHPSSTASLTTAAPAVNNMDERCIDRIPDVYVKAITNIQRHGWHAVHPKGELPVWTVLHWAASEDHADICMQLLAADADPCCADEQGLTPMDYARKAVEIGASGRALRVLQEVARAAAQEDAGVPDLPASSSSAAPASSNLPMLNLASASASVKEPPCIDVSDSEGTVIPAPSAPTPLSRVTAETKSDHGDIPSVYASAIAAVERYGWETVHGGENEWTALHWAAAEGRAYICARLLDCAADPCQPDNLGRSALDYAHEADDESTLKVLLEGVAQWAGSNADEEDEAVK